MAYQGGRFSPSSFLSLPLEVQLTVLDGLGGPDLCAVEASCQDLRRLVASNVQLYQRALAQDFGLFSVPPSSSSPNWKALYVESFVKVRLDTLEQQRHVYNALKIRLEELDDLLGQADDVRELLGSPELLMSEPSMVLAIVGDMEQDVLQQRWDASEDLMNAEAKMLALQTEVQGLLARVPRCWRSQCAHAALTSGGCTIA